MIRYCLRQWMLVVLTLFAISNVQAAAVAEHLYLLEADLDQPSAVAVDDKGRAYVLDGVNGRVVVFEQSGARDFEFGRPGKGDGELTLPMDLTIDSGLVYVADSLNSRIAIFNLRGEFVRNISLIDFTLNGLAPEPVGIDSFEGVLTWSDRRHHRVCQMDVDSGELIKCWGQRGEEKENFQFPFQLATDKDGYLHVVDVLNARVQQFNFAGRRFTQIGRFGLESGELYRPNGIAFDKQGRLYVSDSYRGTVSVFDEGRFQYLLSDQSGDPIRFDAPVGLTIKNQKLYVADARANRVEVFQLQESKTQFSKQIESGRLLTTASQKNCISCHLSWADNYSDDEGVQDGIPPVATERMCFSCHHGAVIDSRLASGHGEQHPDVHNLREHKDQDKKREDKIPKAFPLVKDKKLSCGSCHTPHSANVEDADTLYKSHGNPWLRVLNNDGDLCQQCHESKLDTVLDKQNPPSGVNHPIGIYLKTPPSIDALGYASSKKLHKGLPQELVAGGVNLGNEQQLICQSCHQIHGAETEALTPMEFEEGEMCITCHERQHAKDEKAAREKGVHPVGMELDEPIKMGDESIKKITCLTCHSVHEGEKGTALLKHEARNGKLCSYCHEEYEAVVASDHDLRVTAKESKNRLGQTPEQAGACGSCHTMHRGDGETPFLYAGEYQVYEGEEPALGRDRLCLDCHREEGVAEKALVEHFSHPAKTMVLRSDSNVMPLVNEQSEIHEFGAIACISCHDPHRWQPKVPKVDSEPQPPSSDLKSAKNIDGNVLNSFLRRKGAKGTFCVDCHGLETRVKYKYYHDELARDNGIDYLD